MAEQPAEPYVAKAPPVRRGVSRGRMKRFLTISAFWAACFVLLFLFYFVNDFYVVVGSGPRSWKKSEPLSPGERFILSFVGATAVTVGLAIVAAVVYYLYRAARWLRGTRR